MSAKKWSFSYNRGQDLELKQNILDTLSLWGAIGLLWYSFLSIIKEHFPEFLEVIVVPGDLLSSSNPDLVTFETHQLDWFMIVLLILFLWVGFEWPSKYLKKWALLVKGAGVLLPGIYLAVNFDKVVDGFIGLASLYLPQWNAYYKMNLYLGVATNHENSVVAFTTISMLFWVLVWTLSYLVKKRVLLVLFPVIALGMELLVGLSSEGNGLIVAFFAAILLLTLGGVSVAKKAVALACVGASILITGVAFGEDIAKLVTSEKKQEILDWQKEWKWDDFNLLNLIQIDFHFNREQLNNGTPQYSGKTVLKIETDKKPITTVYLKGFYATNYENGDWTYDDSTFRAACKEAGMSTEEVAQLIFQMPYERMVAYFEESAKNYEIEYTIKYTGSAGDVGYAPYLTDFTSSKNDYKLMGDYLLKRSIWDGSTKINGFNGTLSWNLINEAIAYGSGDYTDLSYVNHVGPVIDLSSQKEQLDFLNSLSNAYLSVPETDGYLLKAGNAIEESMHMYDAEDDLSIYDEVDNENTRRIAYAYAVAEYLASQMSYSLKLDTLPLGTDPIEYALTESHEGYCMHFASAATLLLRQAGIPARYVSGYAVESNVFVKDSETGLYTAEVGDFMAHAWVEVYLENIGWVDLEVTPGRSLENLPTQADINRWEDIAEANRDKYKPPVETETEETQETQETQNPQETQQPSQNTEPESVENSQNPSESQQPTTPSESESNDTQSPGGTGIGGGTGMNGQTWKVLGVIGAIVSVMLVVLLGTKYGVDYYEELLREDIEAEHTRKAVKRINRRMYHTLRIRSPKLWISGKLTDIEYEKTLKEHYPEISEEEWKQFMDIVKKNHYSHEKITVEEMQYCYNCYQKCTQKQKG